MTEQPNSPAPLCFIDTETTGLHPTREAWDVALIRRDYDPGDPNRWTETEVQFFVDVDLAGADPFALKVGGFHDRHPMGQWIAGGNVGAAWPPEHVTDELVLPGAAARTIARMTHGAHLVGAVPNFDADVFDRLLRSHGLLPGWHHHLIDVETMAVGWLGAWSSQPLRWATGIDPDPVTLQPGLLASIHSPEVARGAVIPDLLTPPWRSDDLAKACGVEPPSEEDRHTALGDARWAMRWYDAMTGRPPARGTFIEMAETCSVCATSGDPRG